MITTKEQYDAYMDAVDVVCIECPYIEDACDNCPVRMNVDLIERGFKMKLNDFLTMHKAHAIVITVDEYRSIKDKLREFYTDKDFEHIDDYCEYKPGFHRFLLCNPYEKAQIRTPMMLENAVTFVDRISFGRIEIEEGTQ